MVTSLKISALSNYQVNIEIVPPMTLGSTVVDFDHSRDKYVRLEWIKLSVGVSGTWASCRMGNETISV